MNKCRTLFILSVMIIIAPLQKVRAQDKTFVHESVFSIFVKKENHAKRDSVKSLPIKRYTPYFAAFPFVGYNPAYGVLVGIGTSIGMLLGDPVTTPISSAGISVNFTSKDQKIFNFRTNIVTGNSQFILRGDWRYLVFSQPTYGLGSGIKHYNNRGLVFSYGADGNAETPEEQPLNYNYLRLYETIFLRLAGKFYAGIGYCLDDYNSIVDHELVLDSLPKHLTSHYKYSIENGFNPERYTISGFSFECLLDSRDNSIRPTKGIFANIGIRSNFKFLGSSKNSWMLNSEFRTYLSLSKRRPDHLIAFWYIGQFTERGTVPYLGLPAITWDMYNRSGRGYIQGSIRGVDFLYAETEYRFPISRYTGILGGVLFADVTTASSYDKSRALFESWDPAAGAGLRVMFSAKTLSNLCIDCGFGADGTVGVFFNLTEAF